MAAVRVPGEDGRRQQTVRQFQTFWGALQSLRLWLADSQVSLVVMEATGVYWGPVVRHEAPF